MNLSNLKALRELGQSIWLDHIQRSLITGGELGWLVAGGLFGMTSNPSIFNKAIGQSNEYDSALRAALESDPTADAKSLYERLAIEDIQLAADVFRPVYDATDGLDGLVSLEASPYLAHDAEGTIAEARRLWARVNRPNLMIKVPATAEGIAAIRELTAEGINVNATLLFSVKNYEAVSRAYLQGIARNPNPHRVASVASFFVSRLDTCVDKELGKISTKEALAQRGKAAIANSKLAYRRFREVFSGKEFAAQQKRGARIQRVLWGSTSTKNPAYSDILYVQELIGPDTINTIPLETIYAFCEHGAARQTITGQVDEAERFVVNLTRLGINLNAVTEKLQTDGVKAFADAFTNLLTVLEAKRGQLARAGRL